MSLSSDFVRAKISHQLRPSLQGFRAYESLHFHRTDVRSRDSSFGPTSLISPRLPRRNWWISSHLGRGSEAANLPLLHHLHLKMDSPGRLRADISSSPARDEPNDGRSRCVVIAGLCLARRLRSQYLSSFVSHAADLIAYGSCMRAGNA